MSSFSDRIADYLVGKITTSDGKLPRTFDESVPDPTTLPNGQHMSYWVLSEAERAKGFVRPVRMCYRHVGIAGPTYPLRALTDTERIEDTDWIYYEAYPDGSDALGRYWSQADLDAVGKGCGCETYMSRAIAESYARDPAMYGSTFCIECGQHRPVGADGEFVWDTGERVGT